MKLTPLQSKKSEVGSILLYTVLILAALTLISGVLMRLFIPKFKLSGEAISSTIALYAADTGTEWCLYIHSGNGGASSLPAGPSAYWKLDETSGSSASDSSVNGITGTLVGSPAWVAGKVNNALSFSGANYVNFGDVYFLDGVDQLSVSLWVRPSNLNRDYQHIIGKRENTAFTAWGLQTGFTGDGTNDELFILLNDGSTNYAATNTNILALNVWTHIVFVYDGTQVDNATRLILYINGSPVTLTFPLGAIPAAITANSIDFTAAFPSDPADSYWAGNLDEIQIYSRPLTQAEVTQLFTYTSSQITAPAPILNINPVNSNIRPTYSIYSPAASTTASNCNEVGLDHRVVGRYRGIGRSFEIY